MRLCLILLDLIELDVILRMDFLTKYHTSMDCSNKEVVFRKPSKVRVKFVGDKKVNLANIILIVKARKLMNKGCNAYLAHIVYTKMKRKDPQSMSIVYKYLDVFSEKLSRLPPYREIESN